MGGTDSAMDGTGSAVDGTDSEVGGTGSDVDGTDSAVGGTDSAVDGDYEKPPPTGREIWQNFHPCSKGISRIFLTFVRGKSPTLLFLTTRKTLPSC